MKLAISGKDLNGNKVTVLIDHTDVKRVESNEKQSVVYIAHAVDVERFSKIYVSKHESNCVMSYVLGIQKADKYKNK